MAIIKMFLMHFVIFIFCIIIIHLNRILNDLYLLSFCFLVVQLVHPDVDTFLHKLSII